MGSMLRMDYGINATELTTRPWGAEEARDMPAVSLGCALFCPLPIFSRAEDDGQRCHRCGSAGGPREKGAGRQRQFPTQAVPTTPARLPSLLTALCFVQKTLPVFPSATQIQIKALSTSNSPVNVHFPSSMVTLNQTFQVSVGHCVPSHLLAHGPVSQHLEHSSMSLNPPPSAAFTS